MQQHPYINPRRGHHLTMFQSHRFGRSSEELHGFDFSIQVPKHLSCLQVQHVFGLVAYKLQHMPSYTDELNITGFRIHNRQREFICADPRCSHHAGRKGVQGAESGPVLSWPQRVKIAFGAARGLDKGHMWLAGWAQPRGVKKKLFHDIKFILAISVDE
ncbi:hypothetical protein C5167_014569, partial [Papaver somniferum]